jgi:hypothetical protein
LVVKGNRFRLRLWLVGKDHAEQFRLAYWYSNIGDPVGAEELPPSLASVTTPDSRWVRRDDISKTGKILG